jgi:hypothetical protein
MPIERRKQTTQQKPKSNGGYEIDKHFIKIKNAGGRGTIYENNYIPIFCVETALWLAECSWQTCK